MESETNPGRPCFSLEGETTELGALEFPAHEGSVNSCVLIHGDSIIATCSDDKSVAFWRASTGEQLQVLSGHTNHVVVLATDEHRHQVLSGSWDKSAILWDYSNASQLWAVHHEALVTTCHLDPQQHLAVTGCDNGHFYLWDKRTGRRTSSQKGHCNSIMCCQFSHDGHNLCTCSMDRTALVWDVRMLKTLLRIQHHANVVSSCTFSHDDRYLCTCSWDKTVRVFDIATGMYRSKGPLVLHNHEGCVSGCAFSRDDKLLVSCGYDLTVSVWDTSSFSLQSSMRGNDGWINDVCFGEGSRWIVTASKEGTVKLWDLHAGSQGKRRRHHNTVKCTECGRVFSSISLVEPGTLCVFCRTLTPDRSLENLQIP